MKTKNNPDITKELLWTIFDYRDGILYRKRVKETKVKKEGQVTGSVMKNGYRICSVFNRLFLVHRLVFMMFRGYFPEFVDHINHNRDDNRIENLREAQRRDNNRNAKRGKNNKSGCPGVYWDKTREKWIAAICIDYKTINLGGFPSFLDAVAARKAAENREYGEFAPRRTT